MIVLRTSVRTFALRALGAREALAAHPRHVTLFAVVAGLLLGPLWAPGVLAATALALVAPSRLGVGLLGAAAVLAGAAAATARLQALDAGGLAGANGRSVSTRVVVLEPVRTRASGLRAARVRLLDGPGAGQTAAARIDRRAPWPPRSEVGEILEVRGVLARLASYEAYQARRGASAALVVEEGRATGRRRTGLIGGLDTVRRRAEAALARGLRPPEASLLRGMVLGQDEGIAEPVQDEFRRTGLAHLVAASGQNVMLLATLALGLGAAVGISLRTRLGVALVLVALYVPLAGGGPSIQRAGIMGAAGLVAALAGRPGSRFYALGLAAAVTLALNPRVAGEPGWQLSFAAVVALLTLAPAVLERLQRMGCPRGLAEVSAITLSATLGTAPLMALHFESVAPASLPANLLVAPAVAPVMWLGMIAGALGQVSVTAAAPFTALCAYPVAYVEWVAHVVARLPAASLDVRLPGPAAVALAYAAMGATVLLGRRLARQARRLPRAAVAAGCGLALVLATVAVHRATAPPARAPDELVVSFLDVGQGDATLLQHGDAAVLVDTGSPGCPILARLREAGVDRLDMLVLTHAEADHEGMALSVLRAHPTRLVLNGGAGADTQVQRSLPAAAAGAGARTLPARAGQELRRGPLDLRILWPPPLPAGSTPATAGNPNDRAVVAHVRDGDFDLLLPADAESAAFASVRLPEVDALKVAHHGSTDEGLPAQLATLRPRFAAIEVGARNTYGHPTASTLNALRAVPQVMRTDRSGTIRLHVRGGRMWAQGSRP